jgi:hypothetical protein
MGWIEKERKEVKEQGARGREVNRRIAQRIEKAVAEREGGSSE